LVSGKDIGSVTKEERQAAKPVNFGLIYAMGARGLCNYAREAFGISMNLDQPEHFRQRFFEAYTGISTWHGNLQESWECETRTILGRRRQWIDSPGTTKLLNTPVQGTAADIIKKALVLLNPRLNGTGALIVGCVHDEIILETPIEIADEIALILKQIMEEAAGIFLKLVPVEADVMITNSWAEK
jgi:DNA polymerase-1